MITKTTIIHHTRKISPFKSQKTWIKIESRLFDVTMGVYDGMEVCELVRIYLLYEFSKLYEKKRHRVV